MIKISNRKLTVLAGKKRGGERPLEVKAGHMVFCFKWMSRPELNAEFQTAYRWYGWDHWDNLFSEVIAITKHYRTFEACVRCKRAKCMQELYDRKEEKEWKKCIVIGDQVIIVEEFIKNLIENLRLTIINTYYKWRLLRVIK